MQGPGLGNNQNVLQQLVQQQLGYTNPNQLQGSNQYGQDPRYHGRPRSIIDMIENQGHRDRGLQERVAPPWSGYNRTRGRREEDDYRKEHVFRKAHNAVAYGEGTMPGMVQDPNDRNNQIEGRVGTGFSQDRRIDRFAKIMNRGGFLNDENYQKLQGNQPQDQAQIAKIRKELGEMMNNTPVFSEMMGGFGNTQRISEGASDLAQQLISGDMSQLGNSYDSEEKERSRGIIQRQLSRQMMDNIFTDNEGKSSEDWNEKYGTSEEIGTVLKEFSKGGGLSLKDLTKNMPDGTQMIDPEQFKNKIGDNVTKMVDTLDALGDVYRGLDTKTLLDIGGLVTGLDPQDVRNAGRINATVRQTMAEARRFGEDPKEYINMIQEGAQMLAASGYDQQASGMISQAYAGHSGVEAKYQQDYSNAFQQDLADRRGFTGVRREGFREMSMQDIHKRNMLNFGGALQDKRLSSVSLGLTEMMQQQKQRGFMTADQEAELENMIQNGPKSREDLMKFAARMEEETGFKVFNRSGTEASRMSSFQAEDTDNFRKLMMGTVRSTNRNQGWDNIMKSTGLGNALAGGGPEGQDAAANIGQMFGEIGKDIMPLMDQLNKAEGDPDAMIRWAADAKNAFSGRGARIGINRTLSEAGTSLEELTERGADFKGTSDEEKEALLKAAGKKGGLANAENVAFLERDVFQGGGTIDENVIIETRALDKVRQMREANNALLDQHEGDKGKVSGTYAAAESHMDTLQRDPEYGPSDREMGKAEHQGQQLRMIERRMKEKRENRLDKFDVTGGSFWEGVADGTTFDINKALEKNDLSRSDLRSSEGRIHSEIMDYQRDTLLKFRTGKKGKAALFGEWGADGKDEGAMEALMDVDNAKAEPMLDNLADQWGFEKNEGGREKVRKRIAALREKGRKDKGTKNFTTKEQDDYATIADELGMGASNEHKEFRKSVDLADSADVTGEKDFDKMTDTPEIKKARALEETLYAIQQSLANTSDNVQRVSFAEPLTATLITDGGLQITLNNELNN
jgi:hypothetical protein